MKQFLTLCLATAMLGTAINADAKVKYSEAMQQKGAKTLSVKPLARTFNSGAIKTLTPKPASGFHKLMAEKSAKSEMRKAAPSKVTQQGDNIYGFLMYSADETEPTGLYEFETGYQDLIWEDNLIEQTGVTTASTAALYDGKVVGYAPALVWIFYFGTWYYEYDFETGELLNFIQDESDEITFIQVGTTDTANGVNYGYGMYQGGSYVFMSAPCDDPFNYTVINADEPLCFSLCYNEQEDALFGINADFNFVKIDKETGVQEVLATLDVPDPANYISGLTYDPASNLYYWNYLDANSNSYMATIDGGSYALDIYEQFDVTKEYAGLFTTDQEANPDKPKRPEAGEVDFYKNNLIGNVTFTLPSEMSDGAKIDGDVDYTAYVNNEIYSTGKGAAGSEVTINFVVPEDGQYSFAMTASINGVESNKASVRKYVGNDTPVAPAEVSLTDSQVTWSPVTEGVHGGYVQARAVTYTVTLNGEVVAEGVSDTSCPVEIDKEAEMSTYVATVIAVCNGHESTPASSNTIVEGSPLQLPVYIQPDPEEFAISTILDGNEDGASWTLMMDYDGDYCINSGWNGSLALDEYYFLPPVQIDDVEKFYTFSMDAMAYSSYYPDEYVEVILCNEPTNQGAAVVGEIIPEFMCSTEDWEHVSGEFRVRQPGAYYIAIHATSDPDQYGVLAKNFTIEDNNITLESPAAVDDLELEAGAEGALKATAKFTMPAKNLAGADLAADAELVANLSCGSKTASVSGKPGEEVSAEIETAQGNNVINVTVSLGDFNSPVVSDEIYTGSVVPAAVDPATMTAEVSADGLSLTVTWQPVTEGDIEGYFNPATVIYDVYVYDSDYGWLLYEGDVKETSYVYTPEVQELAQVGVVTRNEAGSNYSVSSVADVVGPALFLPIAEDFSTQGFVSDPWVIYSYDDVAAPSVFLDYASNYGDYDNNIILGFEGMEGDKCEFGTPFFTTAGKNSVVFSMDVCGDFFLPATTVVATCDGKDFKEIGTLAQDEEGFQRVSFELPEEFLNKDRVQIRLVVEFESADDLLLISGLYIEDPTGVNTLNQNAGVKIAGGKGVINVSGLNGESVVVANLGGTVVAKTSNVTNAAIQVEKGIYVVEAAGKKAKVVVK